MCECVYLGHFHPTYDMIRLFSMYHTYQPVILIAMICLLCVCACVRVVSSPRLCVALHTLIAQSIVELKIIPNSIRYYSYRRHAVV